MILGIDVSTYFEELAAGNKYYQDGKEIDPLKLFKEQGVTHQRIRVWNDPYDENGVPYGAGTCDVNNFLKLSKLGYEKYGLRTVLDFHYSDFWADPGKQFCPKAWQNMSFEEAKKALYDFSIDVLTKAKKENLPIDFVQVGNEITNGMCYPFGRLGDDLPDRGYKELSELLTVGINAVHEIFPNAKAIIHLEGSCNQPKYQEYFDHLEKYHVPYDIIGMSYYAYWHGDIPELFDNIKMCQKRYGKPVMIVEIGYPYYLKMDIEESRRLTGYPLAVPYPHSEEGQVNFLKDIFKRAKEVNLDGIFYWEPLWIPGPGINWGSEGSIKYTHEKIEGSLANEWPECLFDRHGNMLPGFKEFKL